MGAEQLKVLFLHSYGILFLFMMIVLSGLSVGYVAFENRRLHNSIQQELEHRNNAQVEWGKLLLEHSTLTAPGRIEKLAREKLGMEVPTGSRFERLRP